MNYKTAFSQILINCRKESGLSQKALAEILGITDAAINMMEKSKRSPSFEILCSISDYFDVSIDYLVGRTDNPHSHKL